MFYELLDMKLIVLYWQYTILDRSFYQHENEQFFFSSHCGISFLLNYLFMLSFPTKVLSKI